MNATNYANDGYFWLYMTGGLNYHREHHLFPNYCHGSYYKISVILRDFCEAKGIKYKTFDGFYDALKGFFSFMRQMGAEDYP